MRPSAAVPGTPTGDVPLRPRRGPVARLVASGFGRIAGISASLVGTQALTSVLGLAFWALAAREFVTAEVGVAGAAVAMMLLLGSLGSLGLGTVLIARLPGTPHTERRVLVRTCLAAAGLAGGLLGLVVPALAVHVFGAANLAPIAGSGWPLLGLALGTALTSMVMVLDQAVLTIGLGTLQLERNVASSGVKVVALVVLGLAGVHGGMTILLAWTIGNLLSLPLVSWRTRGGRAAGAQRRLIEPSLLRGVGRLAVSHHALNVTIQAALQLLPVLVIVLVSARANAAFNAAIMLSGFVFALPYAVSVGLFAAASGDETEIVRRMRLTIPFGLAVSASASLVLLPLAGPVLHLFGPQYAADGAVLLRLIVLAGIPFVIKDHFIALRRVQGRTTQALAVTFAFLVAELAAATTGALLGGVVGLCVAWLGVLAVEAVVLAVPLVRAYRQDAAQLAASAPAPAPEADATTVADVVVAERQAPTRAASPGRGLPQPDDERDTGRMPRIPWSERDLLGPLLLVMAAGVFVMAIAANLGRLGNTGIGAQVVWYVGLVVVFLPAALRIVARSTPHRERMLAVVGLAMALQLSRLVLNPTRFVFHDEFIHADTLRQIIASGHLFTFNPLLPVSAYYPGLEIATDAVRSLTGLPVYASAVTTLLIARLVIVLAIVGLIAAIGGSRRAGAVGALVYLANPQLLFFNSQYSYQTLALPLAVLCIYLVATRRRGVRSGLVLPLAATAAVVVTHHLTALLLIAAYVLWFAVLLVLGLRRGTDVDERRSLRRRSAWARDRVEVALLAVWGVVVLGISVLNPGNPIAAYLEAIFGSSGAQLIGLSEGERPKTLFADSAGTGPLLAEQLLLIAAVLLTMVSLLVVLGFIRTGWRGARPLALVLGVVGLLYPVVPGGHLTSATAEVGDRAAGFVFVGLAAALGMWWWARTRRRWTTVGFGLAIGVTFLGSVVLGSGPASGQLPGPYQVSADARSVDADNIAAAEWQATGLPADSVVYGDRVSGLLAAADGGQRTVLHVSTDVDASRLLLAPTFTTVDIDLIKRARLDYLIVDERLSSGLPHQQFYIESGEYEGQDRTKPVSAAALAKFQAVPGVTRVYDNGSIAIYDVQGLR